MNEIYRDRSEGTAARREDLLRKRRDELVMMPHAVRRVVVARRARIAGSLAVIAVAVPLVAAAWTPAFASLIERALPGGAPAPLSTLLFAGWLFGVAGYLASLARAEHRFAVAMSRLVLPGGDVDHDVERLSHERPGDAARAMAHRLEVGSAALPVLAAALLVPASALFAARVVVTRAWPAIGDVEVELASHRWWIGGAAVAIAAVAIAGVTWRLRRERAMIDADDPAAGSELFTLRGLIRAARSHLARARAATRVQLRRRPTVVALTAVLALGFGGYALRGHRAPARAAVGIAEQSQMMAIAPPALFPRTLDGGFSVDVAFPGGQPVAVTDLARIPQGWRATVKIRMIDNIRRGDLRITLPAGDARVLHAADDEHVFTFQTCAGDARLDLRVEPLYQVADGEHVGLVVEPTLTLANCNG